MKDEEFGVFCRAQCTLLFWYVLVIFIGGKRGNGIDLGTVSSENPPPKARTFLTDYPHEYFVKCFCFFFAYRLFLLITDFFRKLRQGCSATFELYTAKSFSNGNSNNANCPFTLSINKPSMFSSRLKFRLSVPFFLARLKGIRFCFVSVSFNNFRKSPFIYAVRVACSLITS